MKSSTSTLSPTPKGELASNAPESRSRTHCSWENTAPPMATYTPDGRDCTAPTATPTLKGASDSRKRCGLRAGGEADSHRHDTPECQVEHPSTVRNDAARLLSLPNRQSTEQSGRLCTGTRHEHTRRGDLLVPLLPHRASEHHSFARQSIIIRQIIGSLNHRVGSVSEDDLVCGYAAAEIGNGGAIFVRDLGAVLLNEARSQTA